MLKHIIILVLGWGWIHMFQHLAQLPYRWSYKLSLHVHVAYILIQYMYSIQETNTTLWIHVLRITHKINMAYNHVFLFFFRHGPVVQSLPGVILQHRHQGPDPSTPITPPHHTNPNPTATKVIKGMVDKTFSFYSACIAYV